MYDPTVDQVWITSDNWPPRVKARNIHMVVSQLYADTRPTIIWTSKNPRGRLEIEH